MEIQMTIGTTNLNDVHTSDLPVAIDYSTANGVPPIVCQVHEWVEIVLQNSSKILYKRSLTINKGTYDKSEYENYRKFREQIAKADNSKIVLTATEMKIFNGNADGSFKPEPAKTI